MAMFFPQLPGEAATLITSRDHMGREFKVGLPIETEDPRIIRTLRGQFDVREVPILRARNLVSNPSFEFNTTGWYDNETGAPVGNLSRTSSYKTSGTYGLRWEGLTQDYLSYPGFASVNIPVTEGVKYSCRVDAWPELLPAANYGMFLLMRFWDAGGYAQGDSPFVSIEDQTEGPQTMFTESVAPPTAVSVTIIIFAANDGTSLARMNIDSVMLLEAATEIPPYFDGDSQFAVWEGTPHSSPSVLYW